MAQMRRGLNKVGSTWSVSRFDPALNWNRFLKDQRRGLTSLNSASVNILFIRKVPLWSKTMLIRHCQGTNAVFVYYPRGLKALKFDNFENSHNSFLWPEYFIDYFCEKGFHVRLWHPSWVYFSAQRQYTAVQKMRTPLK